MVIVSDYFLHKFTHQENYLLYKKDKRVKNTEGSRNYFKRVFRVVSTSLYPSLTAIAWYLNKVYYRT